MNASEASFVTSPHLATSALSIPIWSRQRATRKSTRSSIVSGAVVEARRREEDHRARVVQRREAAQVDRGERRLARDEDELAALLERDRGGAVDEVLHRARRRACPTVAIEQGQITYASTFADPLAYGLRKSFSP